MDLPSVPLRYLALDAHTRVPDASPGVRTEDRTDRTPRRAILCCTCLAHIADPSARLEVSGHHQHTFFNPAGMVYRVLCFETAPGCRGIGPRSEEFTWFPGHRWQVLVCARCAEHLGWSFSGDGTFVALIEERVREADDD